MPGLTGHLLSSAGPASVEFSFFFLRALEKRTVNSPSGPRTPGLPVTPDLIRGLPSCPALTGHLSRRDGFPSLFLLRSVAVEELIQFFSLQIRKHSPRCGQKKRNVVFYGSHNTFGIHIAIFM